MSSTAALSKIGFEAPLLASGKAMAEINVFSK